VAATPSPKASLALVERAARLLSTSLFTADLQVMAADYERQVSEVVDSDDDVSAYVRRLEDHTDDPDDDDEGGSLELMSGDALADELERYLREQTED
jgi:hypothetical protein